MGIRALVGAVATIPSLSGCSGVPAPTAVADLTDSTLERCVPVKFTSSRRAAAVSGNARMFGESNFNLPAGAVQGGQAWYALRAKFRVRVALPASGFAIISGSTNGRTAIQIKLLATRSGLKWSTKSIYEASAHGTDPDGALTLGMANYLQRLGVRGGKNVANFRVEAFDGMSVTFIEVQEDSCILRSAVSPDSVSGEVRLPGSALVLGETYSLRVRLRNTGSGTVRSLKVAARPLDDGLAVKDGVQLMGSLASSATVDIQIRAEQLGNHDLQLAFSTPRSVNLGSQVATIPVVERPTVRDPRWRVFEILIVLIALGVCAAAIGPNPLRLVRAMRRLP